MTLLNLLLPFRFIVHSFIPLPLIVTKNSWSITPVTVDKMTATNAGMITGIPVSASKIDYDNYIYIFFTNKPLLLT